MSKFLINLSIFMCIIISAYVAWSMTTVADPSYRSFLIWIVAALAFSFVYVVTLFWRRK